MSVQELTPFDFRINAIENGWLFAGVDVGNQHFDLSNSYLGGQELPKALLRACCDFLSGNADSEWLCWHGESHGFIWYMHRQNELLHLEIYPIGITFGLPVRGAFLAEKVRSRQPVVCAALDLFFFGQVMCDAFREYRHGDALEQWNRSGFQDFFPTDELAELRKALRRAAALR